MKNFLVLQTDFGLCDGAVSAMYGVSLSVDPTLQIYDLTHEIPQFNVWEGSYRLYQTVPYWPKETVFVSVVDPGVGSDRLSIAVKTKGGHYIITPDNGTLTHIKQHIGIEEVRLIDERIHRLPNSDDSHTFHGRDIYAFTGARLAARKIRFEEIGKIISENDIVELIQPKSSCERGYVKGNIDILDVRFGNVWTNIDRTLFSRSGIEYGDAVEVRIFHHNNEVYCNTLTFGKSFVDGNLGEALVYINSVGKVGIALNQGSFAEQYDIGTGINWRIQVKKVATQLFSNRNVVNYLESNVSQ